MLGVITLALHVQPGADGLAQPFGERGTPDMSLLDILNAALNSANQHKQVKDDDIDRVVDNATPADLGRGVGEAFRSDKTPPMGDMVGSLFGRSNGTQQAGALNQIIAALGPAVVAGLASGALGKVLKPGQTQITPAQAKELSPEAVRDVVTEAQAKRPELADQLGEFYAQHSGLIKTLGAGALLVALHKMKQGLETPPER